MQIQECRKIWGASEYIRGIPNFVQVQSAIYVPFTIGKYISDDDSWGIFDRELSAVDSAQYKRGDPAKIVSGGFKYCGEPPINPELGSYVYLGPIMQHYGHFLTASLARAWYPYLHGTRGYKFLVHAEISSDEILEIPYARDILGALGISRHNLVVFNEPKKIENLIIPSAAIVEQNHVFSVYGDMCRHIGAYLSRRGAAWKKTRRCYLSKERLAAGVCRLRDEKIVSDHLRTYGFEVLFPEQMNIADQIDVYNESSVVIGTGSSLHTAIFCSSPAKLISLTINNSVNSNFNLFDLAGGFKTEHVLPGDEFEWRHLPENLCNFVDYMRQRSSIQIASDTDLRAFMSEASTGDCENFARALASYLCERGFLE
ncbi:glycosyltransferase family 61 protein [Methylobacterium fujisawaense]